MEPVDQLLSWGTTFFIGLVVVVVLVAVVAALVFATTLWFRYKDREEYSLHSVLLEVALPRGNEIKIDTAEQMFSALASLHHGGWQSHFKPQDHVSFEIVAMKEDIRFYVSCSDKLRDMVEKQIHGAYPGAELIERDEYNVFSDEGKVEFAKLKLKKSNYFPIKAYKDLPTDPLSSLTAAMAKMGPGEGAVVQFLVVPAGDGWKKGGEGYLSSTKKSEADPDKATYTVDQRTYEAITNKIGKPGFETEIRVVVSSTSKDMAKSHMTNIVNTFGQFTSAYNGFGKDSLKWFYKSMFMVNFIYRYQSMFGREKAILSSEELATVFHLPNKLVDTPHIHWLQAKSAPAPAEIPSSGLYLGKSRYRGITRDVYMGPKDRQRHMYIVGKTGTGKSEFLTEMILQDIKAGKGVCFIDPHDTVEKLLELIPPERAEDVIYFDPSDQERPMGLNMLEAADERQQHFVVNSVIGLMYKLYDPHKTGIIGPRFEHAIRNAMLTVMTDKGASFVEVVRVLTDAKYVQELLPKVKDPIVRRYWTDQIAQTSDFHKSEVLDYIVSKFGRFVTDKMMRNIIGQSQSSFNFREVMDKGKILLINLAKGRIGEENSNFLGLVLIPKILVAAMSRQDVSEDQRPDFHLYVDEFQNFATPDFATILSEARKYHLNLTVANQFIGQMDEEVKQAVFGNVGTLVTFRVGVTDANFLQHEFTPTFTESDLTNVERFHAYIKTIVNNEPVVPFSMDLTKDMGAYDKDRGKRVADMIKQLSRLKYGQSREIVEEEINRRSNL